MTINSRLEEVRVAAREVRAFCRGLGMAPEEADGVELAVVEAVNNAVIHAYSGKEGGRVEVEMIRQPGGGLVFAVTDWGRSFDFPGGADRDLAVPDEAAAAPAESGRGLAIMWGVMDRVEYASANGANTLRLFKGGAQS